MKTKLLIDGDILVYRLGFAAQARDHGVEPIQHAIHLVKKCIKEMTHRFETENIKIYLTSGDRSNFRFAIATTLPYKGNRDKNINPKAPDKPYHYDNLRRYILYKYNTTMVTGIEADDAMGIAQMYNIDNPDLQTIICSIDKDMDMIPGLHYNFVTDELYSCDDPGELMLSSSKRKLRGTGYKWFYAQMLLGDSSDNIPGIPMFGPVKTYDALKDMNDEESMWKAVERIYLDRLMDSGLTYEQVYDRLYEVADLLWIWRKPHDCKSSELKLLDKIPEGEIIK